MSNSSLETIAKLTYLDFDIQEFLKFAQVSKTDCLKIFHLNIRSLCANSLQFSHFLNLINDEIDLIILGEAWINNIATFKSLFANYDMYYTDKKNKAGGVVILTYKKTIKVLDTKVDCLKEADSIVCNFQL